MLLNNFENNLILTWSANCFIIDAPVNSQVSRLTITYTKFYVPVVTLSTQDNAKLLRQLQSGFKCTINLNKYHSKAEPLSSQNPYLSFLIDPSFSERNWLFYYLMLMIVEYYTTHLSTA